MQSPLLAPIMALVLWSFLMCAWLYATRIPAREWALNLRLWDPKTAPACINC